MNTNLRSLGLEPTLLSDGAIAELIRLAAEHRERIDARLIAPRVEWRPQQQRATPRQVAS